MLTFVLKAGDLAYVDQLFSGLIPVKILADVNPQGSVLCRITAKRWGYARGEVLHFHEKDLVARKSVHVQDGQYWIRGRTVMDRSNFPTHAERVAAMIAYEKEILK